MFFGLAGLAIMAAAVTATVTSVNANSTESDLLSQNLEALTQSEGSHNHCSYCYSQYDLRLSRFNQWRLGHL